MHLKTICTFLVVSCLSTAAHAVPTITAGNWTIHQTPTSVDSSGLPIAIMISGGDAIQGVNLFMTSGFDGITPFSGPLFQAVDLVGVGTIFNPNNTGQDSVAVPPLTTFETTTTSSGTVAANGVLAYLTFDPTGVPIGIYQLLLSSPFVIGAATDTPPFLSPILINGTVTVFPEPGSIVLGLFAAAGFCVVALRHRRKVT